ncbi:CBS domain-containing protein [Heliobacterium gestii]|uniref:CBS domain-containing protein n=1 Tax=Heliomicrobium gestii TaxID=2699 RepID=A0A845LD35_HELGE|nr:CBS domain-containing protein [Heliomicrobium gestii]MBM7866134.1 acetoin utilization protein AcuB [Heliomicrobium gestii]MZP42539.1 CBS domain-containing protein [Heliomicrobium gestii]
MIVRDKMVAPVVTAGLFTPIRDALRMMTEKNIRRMPVVDDKERLVGIVAFHDIDKAMRSPGVIPLTPVEWVMTKNPVAVEANMPLANSVRMMRRYKVSCLPVVAGEKVVGILSVSDILDLCAELLEAEE